MQRPCARQVRDGIVRGSDLETISFFFAFWLKHRRHIITEYGAPGSDVGLFCKTTPAVLQHLRLLGVRVRIYQVTNPICTDPQ